MKIRELEELQTLLDKSMAERKKELLDIKLLINSTKNPILCKVGIALLSAHFEGFIKQAANYYVIHVGSQNKKLCELQTNFSAIHTHKIFSACACAESKKYTVCKDAIDKFLDHYRTYSFKIRDSVIDTNSNPSSKVFKNIVESIGLDFTKYETKKQFIDSDLLKNRNAIVHGEFVDISIDDFDTTFVVILEIMQLFYDQVLEAAINKVYLASH